MTECRFCQIINDEKERVDEDIVFETDHFIGIIDKYRKPSVGLVCLLVTKIHLDNLLELNGESERSLIRSIQIISKSMQSAFNCNGIRIWSAVNKEAGQSIPHFHIHIVPCKTNKDRLLTIVPGGFDWIRKCLNLGKKPIDGNLRSQLAKDLRNEINANN